MVTKIRGHIAGGLFVPDAPLDLPDGLVGELLIITPELSNGQRSILDILNSTSPPGLFQTSAAADKYIEDERNSWDS